MVFIYCEKSDNRFDLSLLLARNFPSEATASFVPMDASRVKQLLFPAGGREIIDRRNN